MISQKPVVVIIGAGASGLAAAGHLIKTNKFAVTILEAQDRIGGRIFSRNIDKLGESSGHFVELGAQWIHGENHAVYDYVQQNGWIFDKRSLTGQQKYFWPAVSFS